MTNLSDFGAGAPVTSHTTRANETRTDRARERRRTYRHGRCRGIAKSKGCRCGGAVANPETDLCSYHDTADEPVTIDSETDLLARWCGLRGTTFEQMPDTVVAAIREELR